MNSSQPSSTQEVEGRKKNLFNTSRQDFIKYIIGPFYNFWHQHTSVYLLDFQVPKVLFYFVLCVPSLLQFFPFIALPSICLRKYYDGIECMLMISKQNGIRILSAFHKGCFNHKLLYRFVTNDVGCWEIVWISCSVCYAILLNYLRWLCDVVLRLDMDFLCILCIFVSIFEVKDQNNFAWVKCSPGV